MIKMNKEEEEISETWKSKIPSKRRTESLSAFQIVLQNHERILLSSGLEGISEDHLTQTLTQNLDNFVDELCYLISQILSTAIDEDLIIYLRNPFQHLKSIPAFNYTYRNLFS